MKTKVQNSIIILENVDLNLSQASNRYLNSNFINAAYCSDKMSNKIKIVIDHLQSLNYWIYVLQELIDIDVVHNIRRQYHVPLNNITRANPLMLRLDIDHNKQHFNPTPPWNWASFETSNQYEELINIIDNSCLQLLYSIVENILKCFIYLEKQAITLGVGSSVNKYEGMTLYKFIKETSQNWDINYTDISPTIINQTNINNIHQLLGRGVWLDQMIKRRHDLAGHRNIPMCMLGPSDFVFIRGTQHLPPGVNSPMIHKEWYEHYLLHHQNRIYGIILNITDLLIYWSMQQSPVHVFEKISIEKPLYKRVSGKINSWIQST